MPVLIIKVIVLAAGVAGVGLLVFAYLSGQDQPNDKFFGLRTVVPAVMGSALIACDALLLAGWALCDLLVM